MHIRLPVLPGPAFEGSVKDQSDVEATISRILAEPTLASQVKSHSFDFWR